MRYEKGSRILDVKEREWAYEKWCEGYTEAEIGDALYVSNKTIYRILKGKHKIKKPLVYEGERHGK